MKKLYKHSIRIFTFTLLFFTLLTSSNAQQIFTLGTGTNSNSDNGYPAPYGNYYTGAKHQMIILASELQALGGGAGTINSLAFDVAIAQGTPLDDFTIKMGATTATSVSSAWETGLTTVYSVSAYTDVTGWNTHTFTTPFVWDGVSNIIIETCFDKYQGTSNYTSNAQMYYSTVGFDASHWINSDGGGICTSTIAGNTSTKRPNMKIGILMQPQTNDLAMVEWTSPQSPMIPSTAMPITIKIRNAGIAMVDTFDVKYSIDGGTTFVTETINDSISAGDTLDYTFATTAYMPDGIYNCVAMVYSTGDTMTANNIVNMTILSGNPLNGTYTIGHSESDDFNSFSEAIYSLENFGVSGAVVFTVAADTFNESVYIEGPIQGVSSVNTITFNGQGKANTIIQAVPISTNYAAVDVDGAKHIIFNEIGIVNGSNNNDPFWGMLFRNAADSNTVANCFIEVGNQNPQSIGIVSSSSANYLSFGNNANYIHIDSCIINHGDKGLVFYGSNSPLSLGNTITNNTFFDQSSRFIDFYYCGATIVSGNVIKKGVNTSYSADGIKVYQSSGDISIANNKIILNGGKGISMEYFNYSIAGSTANIFNNFIALEPTSGTTYGIYLYTAKNINIFYNSISINGSITLTNTHNIYVGGSSNYTNNLSFFNNIYFNNVGGDAYSINVPIANIYSDYNDIYTPSGSYIYQSNIGQVSTLAQWINSSELDSNSIRMNPWFVSNTNLHVANPQINNLGTPLISVTDDIDGNSRNPIHPDMGADEFIPLQHNLGLKIIPSSSNSDMCNLTNNEVLKVQIINQGVVQESFFHVSYQLDGGSIVTETYSDTLDAFDTLIYTFSQSLDLSNVGEHNILAYTSLAGDSIRENDSSFVVFETYQSISSFPFIENFEQQNTYFHTSAENSAYIGIENGINGNDTKVLFMGGSDYNDWNFVYSLEDVINYNQSHYSSAYTCDIDVSNLSSLRLSFDLLVHTGNLNKAWFFVTINDTIIIKDIKGDSVWNLTDYNFENLVFNLDNYLGGNIKIKLNGYFNNRNQRSSPEDYAMVDNIKLWEPLPYDIGVVDIKSSSDDNDCGLVVDSIYLKVMNYGSNSVSNFPVHMVGYYGSDNFNFTEVYSGTIAPDSTAKVFIGTLNTTNNAQVNAQAYSSLSTDQDNSNDTASLVGYNEVYKQIPYIENFDINNNLEWRLSGFFQYENNGEGSLYYDYYYTEQGQNQGYSLGNYAEPYNNYGIVETNSMITFDYMADIYQSNEFSDTLYIYITQNCGQFIKVYTLNKNSIVADNNWHTINVPIGNFNGDIVNFGIFAPYNTCTDNYTFVLDNFGIFTPVDFSLGNDTLLCAGESILLNTGLSLDSGYHFLWHGPTINTYDTLESITVNTAGEYWVDVTDNTGFTVTDSIFVGYYPQIQASFSASKTTLCIGDSTDIIPQLSGVFPMILNWTDGQGIYTDTLYSPGYKTFSPPSTTQYTILSVTDSALCSISRSDSIVISVIPKQSITISGLDAQYCKQDTAILLSAYPLGGSFIGAGMNANIFNPTMAGPGNHNIIYQYVDTNNCVSTDTAITSVFAIPTVSIVSTLDSQYCSNDLPVNLFAFPLGGTFTGSVNSSLFEPYNANLGLDTIIYSFTDAHNCFNADTITTKVVSAPVVNISTTLNNSYCMSDPPISLSATPAGGMFSGMGITDSIFKPSQAGIGMKTLLYSYTDANGCSNYDTVYIIVNPNPIVLITSTLASNYCENDDSVGLTGFPNGGVFSGNGIFGNMFYPDSAGVGSSDIVYSYTDVNGCSNNDTISTTVNALPVVNLPVFNQVCANQSSVNLIGGVPSGGVYIGNAVNTSQGVFYPNNASLGLNEISYKYTDSLGCENEATNMIRVVGVPQVAFTIPSNICKSDTAVVSFIGNVSINATYNWNFDNANVISGANEGPYQLSWDSIGIRDISVSVTDSGCVSVVEHEYTNIKDAIAIATIIGNDSACFGDNILMFANGGNGYTYQWYDTSNNITSAVDTLSYLSVNQTGQYYVKVTDDIGCYAISNTIDVFINPQITSDFALPAVACKGDMVSVNYSGTSSTSAQYLWDFDNGQIASGSAGGPYNIIWNIDSVKTVTLDVIENGCYAGVTTHNIDILTTPAHITALGSTSFCQGGDVTLSANAGNYSYQWYKDGIATANSAVLTTGLAGTYTVEITDNSNNCSNISDSVVVTVNSTNFNISFAATPISFNIPPFNTTFTNTTTNVNDYYWMWSFGDGNTSTFVNPSHQYLYDGTYTVGVIAQNIATGCFDTLVKTDYISCTGGTANPCSLDASFGNIGGGEVCPGDSVKLFANDHTVGVNYQWLKDGILLGGATDSIYYAKSTGLYQLMISNTSCSVFSQPFSLIEHTTTTPNILSNGSIVPCSNDSMELYVSTSFNSYQWSNGSTLPSIYVKNSGSFIVTVTDNNGCNVSSAPFVVNASLLQAPEICIVGIDTATNHNRIVWERQANSLIDSFKIYRETNVAGVYSQIGAQAFSDLSVFEDVNSNPAQQAYRYRITAVDTCGMETPPSSIHKTLHLTINAGLGGVWNLIWSNYEGFTFGSYRIYRGTDSTNMTLLTQIQSTLTSYTDLNPPAGNVYYQIEVISPHPCYPDSIFTKANTNYNSSRSNTANTNMAPNTGFVQSTNNQLNMQIYPNPNKGVFTLEINSVNSRSVKYDLEVYNAMGSIIHRESIEASRSLHKSMHFETLSKGIYFVRLRSKDNVLTTRFVVE